MNIEIVVSLSSRETERFEWQTDHSPSVAEAKLYLIHMSENFAHRATEDWQTAVWGKPVHPSHLLKNGDRLELLRPLRVDPKVARRERFQKQGAKTAGLFAKRRPGAKPGY